MKIVEHTDRRLVIEWRPWSQTWGWLAFALAMTHLMLPELSATFAEARWEGPAGIFLLGALWLKVFEVGQYTRLDLDRDTGLARIHIRSLLGDRTKTVPLDHIDGIQLNGLGNGPRYCAMRLRLRLAGPDGERTTMVPRAHLTRHEGLQEAAIAIARWLDVPVKTR